MLLVDRLDGGNWSAVDPRSRVQVINLRNRTNVATTPKNGVNYTDIPGFSQAQLINFETESAKVAARRRGEDVRAVAPAAVSAKNARKRSAKRKALGWALDGIGFVFSLVSSWRSGLASGIGCFLLWRVFKFLGAWEFMTASFNSLRNLLYAWDTVREISEDAEELYRQGRLEPYIIAGLLSAFIIVLSPNIIGFISGRLRG